MERRIRRKHTAGEKSFFLFCLCLLTLSFLLGIVLGQVSARRTPDAVDAELNRYLKDYCSLGTAEGASGRIFLSALLIYFRYPLIVFLLGFAAPGILLIPALTAVFGFFLSFSAACFADAFGNAGPLVTMAVFGLRATVTLPCYCLLAVPAFQNAVTLLAERISGRGRRILKSRGSAERWIRLCVVFGALLLGALAEVFLTPALLRLALKDILI